jgi:hypothetical protein
MKKLHEQKSKLWFLKYVIFDDRIKIQSPLLFYWFEIRFDDIEKIEIRKGPVFLDMWRQGLSLSYWFLPFRIIKCDLVDFFEHIMIEKRRGYWKQIRFTPRDTKKFFDILIRAVESRNRNCYIT